MFGWKLLTADKGLLELNSDTRTQSRIRKLLSDSNGPSEAVHALLEPPPMSVNMSHCITEVWHEALGLVFAEFLHLFF